MNLDIINPLEFPNWDDLLLESGDTSFFHTEGWARTLHTSYGYKPIYFTAFESGELSFLMPFMEISSWLTGKRGVSLPFSDNCRIFSRKVAGFDVPVQEAVSYGKKARWKYLEWRDADLFPAGTTAWDSSYIHEVDLVKSESALFSSFEAANRRNIKKSGRQRLSVKVEKTSEAMNDFCLLNRLTRKRHGLPPQPQYFFKNIFKYIISQDHGIIVTAYYENKAIASSVFFHSGGTAIFKYGASNEKYHSLRPNNLVLWTGLKWYLDRNFKRMNLGRTESDHKGLLRFKRGWGGEERTMNYYRYDLKKGQFSQRHPTKATSAELMRKIPLCCLILLGRLSYKHFG